MKKLEICLNILHYCIYRAHYNLHLFANKINPFNLIHKLPFQKRRYKELGIDIHEEINKAFANKRYGLSTMVAGGVLFGLLFLLLFSFVYLLIKCTSLSIGYYIAYGSVSFIVCYTFVFKKDKYLLYFKEFEKWTKGERKKYAWMSFFFIVAVIIMFLMPLILYR